MDGCRTLTGNRYVLKAVQEKNVTMLRPKNCRMILCVESWAYRLERKHNNSLYWLQSGTTGTPSPCRLENVSLWPAVQEGKWFMPLVQVLWNEFQKRHVSYCIKNFFNYLAKGNASETQITTTWSFDELFYAGVLLYYGLMLSLSPSGKHMCTEYKACICFVVKPACISLAQVLILSHNLHPDWLIYSAYKILMCLGESPFSCGIQM